MKFIKFEHTYNHDWETVTSAFWVKYPNPLQPHVKRIDTLSFEVDSDCNSMRTFRLMSLDYNIPKWIARLLNSSGEGFGLEEVNCSLSNKTLILKSQNLTFQNVFKIEEICEYRAHPDNPEWTLYTQQATYSVPSLGMFSVPLEKIAAQSALEAAQKGLNAMARKIGLLEDSRIKIKYDRLKNMAIEKWGFYMTLCGTFFHSSYKYLNEELSDCISYCHKMKRDLHYWGSFIQHKANEASVSAIENYEQALKSYTESKKRLSQCFNTISLKSRTFLSAIDRDYSSLRISLESHFPHSLHRSSFFMFLRKQLKSQQETPNDKYIARYINPKEKITQSSCIQSCTAPYHIILRMQMNNRHNSSTPFSFKPSLFFFDIVLPRNNSLDTPNKLFTPTTFCFKNITVPNFTVFNSKLLSSSTFNFLPIGSIYSSNPIVTPTIGSHKIKENEY